MCFLLVGQNIGEIECNVTATVHGKLLQALEVVCTAGLNPA